MDIHKYKGIGSLVLNHFVMNIHFGIKHVLKLSLIVDKFVVNFVGKAGGGRGRQVLIRSDLAGNFLQVM